MFIPLCLKLVYALSDLAHPCKCNLKPPIGLVQLLKSLCFLFVKVGEADYVLYYPSAFFGIQFRNSCDHALLYNIEFVWSCQHYFKKLHYSSLGYLFVVKPILALTILTLNSTCQSDCIRVDRYTSVSVVKCQANPDKAVVAVLDVVEQRLELVYPQSFGTVLPYCKHDCIKNIRLA